MRFAVVRHLASILLLPTVVVVAMPAWLLSTWDRIEIGWDSSAVATVSTGLGGVVFVAGFVLFGWCVALFARIGQGTLAPWDPTRALVAVGPYARVRNPMISAVATMLVGEALWFGSLLLVAWSFVFILVNHVYFTTIEEPGLQHRFGADYDAYRSQVPRWIPRFRR